jgi:putative aldouronate transport system substrate-binding protein
MVMGGNKMNKKKMVRMLGMVLAIFMFVSVFVGCGTQKSTNAAEESTTVGTTAAETAAAQEGPAYSIDTSPIALDWFVNLDWFGTKWDVQKLAYKLATEKTGVTVNFIVPTAGANEKLSTMIAADQLTDIISTEANAQMGLLKTANKLEPLLPLIQKEAPTFEARLPKSMIEWSTAEDGNWYQIANFFMTDAEKGPNNYYNANDTMVARKDIMEQLSITPEDFSTQEGMLAALKKVADAKLTYKDQKVIPFYTGPQAGNGELFQWVLWEMFAVPTEAKDGKLADRRYDPKNLEALKFGNTLYREGLLQKDNFTAQRLQVEEKLATGAIFCFAGNKGDYQGKFMEVFTNDNKAEYVAVGPVRALDGAKPAYGGSLGGWVHTMISKGSEKKQRAIRLLEFMYSEEGTDMMTYGIEGQTYTKQEDGHYKWTETYLKDIKEAQDKKEDDKYGLGLWLVHNWPYVQAREVPPSSPAEISNAKLSQFNAQFLYNNMCEGNLAPEGDSDEAVAKKKIDDYYNLQLTKMLMADSGQAVEVIYNETLKHMDELGQESVMKVMDKKFQANKKKLGVDFIYPTNK